MFKQYKLSVYKWKKTTKTLSLQIDIFLLGAVRCKLLLLRCKRIFHLVEGDHEKIDHLAVYNVQITSKISLETFTTFSEINP